MALLAGNDIDHLILMIVPHAPGFPHQRAMKHGAALGKNLFPHLFPQHLLGQHEASSTFK